MTEKKLVEKIKKAFFEKLEEQTSWGKEQCKKAYLEVQNDVLLRELEPNAKDLPY